jgi:predicted RNA methylase
VSGIPRWHYSMLNDSARNSAFHKAIIRQITEDDEVIDVGAGTGLLSILAARTGARSVAAFEADPQLARIAAETIAESGVGERIALHSTLSANVSFPPHDRHNVLLTEIFDCGLIGEGIIPTLRHARSSLLTEEYTSIPKGATLSGALVASDRIRQLNEVASVCGIDVSRLNRLQTKGHFPVRLRTWPHSIISDESPLLHLDLHAEPPAGEPWEVSFMPHETRQADGIVAWFSMDLGAGEYISTHPDVDSHWMQAFIPFPEPSRVIRDQIFTVQVGIRKDVQLTATPHIAKAPAVRRMSSQHIPATRLMEEETWL